MRLGVDNRRNTAENRTPLRLSKGAKNTLGESNMQKESRIRETKYEDKIGESNMQKELRIRETKYAKRIENT